jgi:hypothetical protein
VDLAVLGPIVVAVGLALVAAGVVLAVVALLAGDRG